MRTDATLRSLVVSPDDDRQYLKYVSRVKHYIYSGYLGAWLGILSSQFHRLRVVDCFAGDGLYVDENGNSLDGSPQRAVSIAAELMSKRPHVSVALAFVERDQRTFDRLNSQLKALTCPPKLTRTVYLGDAEAMVLRILKVAQNSPSTVPSLYFVDPYGHPISIPLMRKLLAIAKSEVLVNLMWYRINMDLGNPDRIPHFNFMFGHDRWVNERFMRMSGPAREEAFLEYFESEVNAPFRVHCTMPYSPEDNVNAPEKRHKYFLLHFSSHPMAAREMKVIMGRAQKKLSALDESPQQSYMPFADPTIQRLGDLKNTIREEFTGAQLKFSELLDRTANLPYTESEHRTAVRELLEEGNVEIDRRESKRDGIAGGDLLRFKLQR